MPLCQKGKKEEAEEWRRGGHRELEVLAAAVITCLHQGKVVPTHSGHSAVQRISDQLNDLASASQGGFPQKHFSLRLWKDSERPVHSSERWIHRVEVAGEVVLCLSNRSSNAKISEDNWRLPEQKGQVESTLGTSDGKEATTDADKEAEMVGPRIKVEPG
ncbi:hypothetical protein QQF64_003215 [Cirrhinus molitorella]|uniref:Uncharacterized protein n=1 Tax=Cirrhinus molitorella TaxID=172907 RepID=A0ABR3MKY6_9TELE